MDIRYSPLYAESWNIAFREKPSGSILDNKSDKFFIIPNSKKYWAADPMVFEYQKKVYIFAELYDYTLCRGTIGYTVFDGCKFSKWKQIIVEEFHMSYPNIFTVNDEIYMIPETSEAQKLILYKAINFPDKWKIEKVIKDGVKFVDTTFLKSKNGYIGYTEELTRPIKDLLLYFDDDLNLLSSELIAEDSKLMRCGGRIFNRDKMIVRVCQDCEEKYGGALIFRICDKESLKEIKSIHISPEQLCYDKNIFLDGMHTYTSIPNMEVIDIKTRRFNMLNLFYRTINKMKGKG